ncbi:hypothetical protein LRAMOSA04224 [Lichtheimia ramosa]|uniref:Uncharacterized protein n=1 Tax=Lichtheimia ramosa TaxID=688394 RepID=A0A077WXW3_9FUNG|nr:hypothetical protein LRAMOSA04224 [Lichtheimia ramosa]
MQLTQRNLKRLEQEDPRCKYQRIQMFVQDQKQILASSAYESTHLASPATTTASKPRRKKTAERRKHQATRHGLQRSSVMPCNPTPVSSCDNNVSHGFSIKRKVSALSGSNKTQPIVKQHPLGGASTPFWLFSKFLCISSSR